MKTIYLLVFLLVLAGSVTAQSVPGFRIARFIAMTDQGNNAANVEVYPGENVTFWWTLVPDGTKPLNKVKVRFLGNKNLQAAGVHKVISQVLVNEEVVATDSVRVTVLGPATGLTYSEISRKDGLAGSSCFPEKTVTVSSEETLFMPPGLLLEGLQPPVGSCFDNRTNLYVKYVVATPALSVPSVSTEKIVMYPNPVVNSFTAKSLGALSVSDITGRVLATNNSSTVEKTFDISSFAPGVYVLRASDGSAIKFVKQ